MSLQYTLVVPLPIRPYMLGRLFSGPRSAWTMVVSGKGPMSLFDLSTQVHCPRRSKSMRTP